MVVPGNTFPHAPPSLNLPTQSETQRGKLFAALGRLILAVTASLGTRVRSFTWIMSACHASTKYSVWPLVEAKTMCRNRLLLKFGTRPPGLSIRCPHSGELAPNSHTIGRGRAQASHRKARVALDRATPSSSSSEIRPEPRSAVQFNPVHKLRGS